MYSGKDPEDYERIRRFALLSIGISIVIQLIILIIYYFREGQELLAFPMALNLLISATAFAHVWQLKQK